MSWTSVRADACAGSVGTSATGCSSTRRSREPEVTLPVLLVVAGPSGSGKGTVLRKLREREPNLWFSVSATTRAPRDGEVDGVDYTFLTRDEFERRRAAGDFLEAFDVFGELRGTPRQPVEDHLAEDCDVLLELDVHGALAVREQMPEAVLVFVRPPSREVQAQRLRSRGQDSDGQIARRLAEASAEEALAVHFDEVVVNDQVDRATEQLAAILAASRRARAG